MQERAEDRILSDSKFHSEFRICILNSERATLRVEKTGDRDRILFEPLIVVVEYSVQWAKPVMGRCWEGIL